MEPNGAKRALYLRPAELDELAVCTADYSEQATIFNHEPNIKLTLASSLSTVSFINANVSCCYSDVQCQIDIASIALVYISIIVFVYNPYISSVNVAI